MRLARPLALSLLVLPSLVPSVALAQYYVAPPPPVVVTRPMPAPRFQGGVWIRWGRRPPPVIVTPAPVYLPAAPLPPALPLAPQPVVIQPPAVIVQSPPAPVYAYPPSPPPSPCCTQAAPAPVALVRAANPPKPQWTSRVGLGATVEGDFTTRGDATKGVGVMGQLRYRAARHLALELMSGWARSADSRGVIRTDVPVTFGLVVPFLGPEHAFTPYFVAAGGFNFADLHLVDTDAFKLDDQRTQMVGQLGGGVELRLGQHFAINADVRVEGRWNMYGPSSDVTSSTVKVDGEPVNPIANSMAVRLGVGGTLYF